MAVAGVLTQDVLPARGVRHFRLDRARHGGTPRGERDRRRTARRGCCRTRLRRVRSSFRPLLVLGIGGGGSPHPARPAERPAAVAPPSRSPTSPATMAGYPGSARCTPCLAWPALWSVPLGFLTMVLVLLATAGRVPTGNGGDPARFHLPEELAGGDRRADADARGEAKA